jgi:hypothetical protein
VSLRHSTQAHGARDALPPCRILYSLNSYSSWGCRVFVFSWVKVGARANDRSQVRAGGLPGVVAQLSRRPGDGCRPRTSLMPTSSPVWMWTPARPSNGVSDPAGRTACTPSGRANQACPCCARRSPSSFALRVHRRGQAAAAARAEAKHRCQPLASPSTAHQGKCLRTSRCQSCGLAGTCSQRAAQPRSWPTSSFLGRTARANPPRHLRTRETAVTGPRPPTWGVRSAVSSTLINALSSSRATGGGAKTILSSKTRDLRLKFHEISGNFKSQAPRI